MELKDNETRQLNTTHLFIARQTIDRMIELERAADNGTCLQLTFALHDDDDADRRPLRPPLRECSPPRPREYALPPPRDYRPPPPRGYSPPPYYNRSDVGPPRLYFEQVGCRFACFIIPCTARSRLLAHASSNTARRRILCSIFYTAQRRAYTCIRSLTSARNRAHTLLAI
jgi:hypothetical protein